MKKIKLKTGFDSERLRKKLLKNKQFKLLASTYNHKYPSIPDENNAVFWDKKFKQNFKSSAIEKYRNQLISQQISINNTVLNIGVGRGLLERIIWQKFAQNINWHGTDIAMETLKRVSEQFPSYHFTQANIEKLPFINKQFDVCLLAEVLEHVIPAKTFLVLREVKRVLKNQAKLIISVPLNEDLEEMMPSNPNAHVRVYSLDLLRFELEHSGFVIEKQFLISAFDKYFYLKNFLNKIFHLRKPNNLILIAQKT